MEKLEICSIHNIEMKMICLQEQCQESSRFACSECFCVGPNHKMHKCDYLQTVQFKIDETCQLLRRNINKIENLQGKEHIEKEQQMILKINGVFCNIKNLIQETMLQIQQQVLTFVEEQHINCIRKYSAGNLRQISLTQIQDLQFSHGQSKQQIDQMIKFINDPKNFYEKIFQNEVDTLLNSDISKLQKYTNEILQQIHDNCQDYQQQLSNLANKNQGFFDIDQFKSNPTFTLLGHTDYIWSIKKYQNNKLISCSRDKSFKIWDLNQQECVKTILTQHNHQIMSMLIFDRNTIITGGSKEIIIYKNLIQQKLLFGHNESCSNLVKIDKTRFISASFDRTLGLWNARRYSCIRIIQLHNDKVYINSIHLISKREFISVSGDGYLKIWAINQLRCVKQLNVDSSFSCMPISLKIKSSKHLVVTGHKLMLKIWNIITGAQLALVHNAHSNFIRDIKQISNDTFVTSSEDMAIKFWKFRMNNFGNGNIHVELNRSLIGQHNLPVYSICKINNKSIATSGRDKKIVVWI